MQDAMFWDRVAEKYFAQPIGAPDVYEEKLRLTQALMHSEMQVLELGCGTGGTALRHAPHVAHIRATDFSEAMLDIARRQAEEAGVDNVEFVQADAAQYQDEAARYDMVLALNLLHLLHDPAALIAKARSWLRPGGYFISSTACLRDKMGWTRFVAPIGRALGRLPYVNVFKAPDLRDQIRSAGFAIETERQPGKGLTLFVIARKQADMS